MLDQPERRLGDPRRRRDGATQEGSRGNGASASSRAGQLADSPRAAGSARQGSLQERRREEIGGAGSGQGKQGLSLPTPHRRGCRQKSLPPSAGAGSQPGAGVRPGGPAGGVSNGLCGGKLVTLPGEEVPSSGNPCGLGLAPATLITTAEDQ